MGTVNNNSVAKRDIAAEQFYVMKGTVIYSWVFSWDNFAC